MRGSASILTWLLAWKVATGSSGADWGLSLMFSLCPCADANGLDINPVQDTPVATRKEDTYIHFSVDVEIQRHVEKLPKGDEDSLSQSQERPCAAMVVWTRAGKHECSGCVSNPAAHSHDPENN